MLSTMPRLFKQWIMLSTGKITIQWIAWFVLSKFIRWISISPAPVVQKVDNAIHRINHYPVDSVVCFVKIYPLDSDLSGG